MSIDATLSALTALGAAWRGDWNGFDGRMLRDQLDDIAAMARKEVAGEDVRGDLAAFYATNDICGECLSWTDYCSCGRDGAA